MAVPKKKTSKSKRNSRRAHDALKPLNIGFDSVSGEPKLSHRMSLDNYYNNRSINVKRSSAVMEDSSDIKEVVEIKNNDDIDAVGKQDIKNSEQVKEIAIEHDNVSSSTEASEKHAKTGEKVSTKKKSTPAEEKDIKKQHSKKL